MQWLEPAIPALQPRFRARVLTSLLRQDAMNKVEMPNAVIGNFIDGRLEMSTSGRAQDVFNPATGQKTRSVVLSSAADVDAAVAAAKAAFPAWSNTPPLRRARVMNKYLGLLNAHKDELARAITAEHGKVFSDAKGEVE